MPGSGITIDVKSAIGDFTKYDQKTQGRFKRTLKTYATRMSNDQHKHLKSRVKKWTGNLGGTISPEKKGEFTYEIGPDNKRAEYAEYIEYGSKAEAGEIGHFAGYHYVKHSVNRYMNKFFKAIKRDVTK
jgi:hypothetical protein